MNATYKRDRAHERNDSRPRSRARPSELNEVRQALRYFKAARPDTLKCARTKMLQAVASFPRNVNQGVATQLVVGFFPLKTNDDYIWGRKIG